MLNQNETRKPPRKLTIGLAIAAAIVGIIYLLVMRTDTHPANDASTTSPQIRATLPAAQSVDARVDTALASEQTALAATTSAALQQRYARTRQQCSDAVRSYASAMTQENASIRENAIAGVQDCFARLAEDQRMISIATTPAQTTQTTSAVTP